MTASNVPLVRVRVRVEPSVKASASWTVPVAASTRKPLLNVVPLLITVVVPRPEKITVPNEPSVTPDPIVQLPYRNGAPLPAFKAIEDVLADASIEPTFHAV